MDKLNAASRLRWEDMTREQLLDAVHREHGWRLTATDEVKRLRAITKDKRDLLAIVDQLDAEVTRLESQTGDFWKKQHDEQVACNRRLNASRRVALDGLWLAVRWLRCFADDGDEPDEPVADVVAAWERAIAPHREEAEANG